MKQTALHTVFMVDDDPDDRQIVSDAFEEIEMPTAISLLKSGNELMEKLENSTGFHLPSIILLDLNMPGKDGREILKEVKGNKLLRQIPVIIFTTSSHDKDRQTCYELGANCFVTKPTSYNILLETIESIVRLWLS